MRHQRGRPTCPWSTNSGLIRSVKEKSSHGRAAKFFTLGYQSHSPRTLLKLLSANGVNVLVDVRQNPVSRKRGFSRSHLQESASQFGIDYLHFPCLGTPPRIRKLYVQTGNVQKALKLYGEHLQSKKKCLLSLISLVTSKQFCLLCLESDYTSCHRSVIAQRLTEMTGCRPVHLK
jgi:uncharacterized protein (DUF488 family)